MSPVRDPIAALVFYADAADIDSVWVDGVARKRGGLLTGLTWDAVRGRLIQSRDHIYEEFAKIDEVAVRNAWAPLWGISHSAAEPAVKVDILP